MKLDYLGYRVRPTGTEDVWKLTRPNGSWVLLRPSEEWDFVDEADFQLYIEQLADLEEFR